MHICFSQVVSRESWYVELDGIQGMENGLGMVRR